MSKKLKQRSSVYSHLKSSGVLENGTPAQIQSARKQYWKEYRSRWRNNKRQTDKEFTIAFNTEELKELTKEAKRHNLSQPKFIKLAFFGYLNKSFVVPDSKEVKRISQLLGMTYNEIQQLNDNDKLEGRIGREALESIWNLERLILPLLNNPRTINSHIVEHIQKSPGNIVKLLELINSL